MCGQCFARKKRLFSRPSGHVHGCLTRRSTDVGKASLTLDQQALRGDEVLAEGRIRIGCVDAQTLRPRRIPPNLLASIGPA